MMTKFLTILLYFFLFITPFTACKKMLDKVPDNISGYLTSIENMQAILDNFEVMNLEKTPGYEEASADDYFASAEKFNSAPEVGRKLYVWDIPSTLDRMFNDWAINYGSVFTANACLEEIDNVSKTAANSLAWNNVKGSACFFRAYYFLHLAWTYAKAYDEATADTDLGIVLQKSTDINQPASVRATVSASYQQIIDDAMQAVAYLPDLSAHPYRPSRAAAYGLLARAYLSMRKYDSAFKYADLCLRLKSDLMNYNGDADLVSAIDQTISPFRRFNKETIFYTETCGGVFPSMITGIDTLLYANYAGNDLRKMAFFSASGIYQRFKGTYTQNIAYLFSGIATDEIWLIRAECYARQDNVVQALNDLNVLLSKRYNTSFFPVSTTDATEALDRILQERRKELLMRDLRWMDIKRLNKEDRNIVLKRVIGNDIYILPPNDNRYALPIPTDVIEMTGMPQNDR